MNASSKSPLLSADIAPLALRLALPGLFSMLALSLSALADGVILARVSQEASAAAALSYPLLTLVQAVGFTLSTGAGGFISRCIGRRAPQDARAPSCDACAAASLALGGALLSGGLLALGGLLFSGRLPLFCAADGQSAQAAAYGRAVLLSAPLSCAGVVLCGILRAQGHLLVSLIAYGAGLLLGAPLCAVLCLRLSMGVYGAGAALIAREALSLLIFIAAFFVLRPAVRPSLRALRLRAGLLCGMARFGLPTLIRQGLMSVSAAMLTRALAQAGPAAAAGMGLVQRACALVSACAIGYLQGFSPVFGANAGAGRADRVLSSWRFCLRTLLPCLAALGAAVFLGAPRLAAAFAPDEKSAAFASAALRAQSAAFAAQGAMIAMNALTQALSMPVRASLIAASRQGYVLIPVLLIAVRLAGEAGLIYAQSVSDAASLLLSWLLCRGVLARIKDSSCGRSGCCDARTGSR